MGTYEPRWYRTAVRPDGLVGFRTVVSESDLMIHACSDVSAQAMDVLASVRRELEVYVAAHPRFAESFVPIDVDDTAPAIVRDMAEAARACGVGPMAAVAGAVAQAVGSQLLFHSPEVIVENGGDTYVAGAADRVLAIWSGTGIPTLGLRLRGASSPCAVATSSATVGPSVSLGSAHAATVIADGGALADAVASAVGNRVHGAADIEAALAFAMGVAGVRGVVVVADGHVGAAGDIELVPVPPELL